MKKTRAIVIGCGAYNDLGMIRSCGQAGMEVVLVAPSSMVVPIYKSKYVTKWIDADINDECSIKTALISAMDDVSQDKRVIIYPTGDKIAIILDHISQSIGECILPKANVPLETLMDKYEMAKMAKNAGFIVPKSFRINMSDIDSYSPEYPIVVKPLKSAFGKKEDIAVCRNDIEFKLCCSNFIKHDTKCILIQSLIEDKGQTEIAIPGVSHGDGVITVGGIIEKKRMIGNGSTVYATFIPGVPKDLRIAISSYMKHTGYQGLFDIEFLRNDKGVFFIECNFRNGAYGYALTSAGLNLPQCFADGTDFVIKSLKKRIFMEERSDILYPLKNKMPWISWLKDLIKVDTFLWWNWRDLGPFMAYYLSKLKRTR